MIQRPVFKAIDILLLKKKFLYFRINQNFYFLCDKYLLKK